MCNVRPFRNHTGTHHIVRDQYAHRCTVGRSEHAKTQVAGARDACLSRQMTNLRSLGWEVEMMFSQRCERRIRWAHVERRVMFDATSKSTHPAHTTHAKSLLQVPSTHAFRTLTGVFQQLCWSVIIGCCGWSTRRFKSNQTHTSGRE